MYFFTLFFYFTTDLSLLLRLSGSLTYTFFTNTPHFFISITSTYLFHPFHYTTLHFIYTRLYTTSFIALTLLSCHATCSSQVTHFDTPHTLVCCVLFHVQVLMLTFFEIVCAVTWSSLSTDLCTCVCAGCGVLCEAEGAKLGAVFGGVTTLDGTSLSHLHTAGKPAATPPSHWWPSTQGAGDTVVRAGAVGRVGLWAVGCGLKLRLTFETFNNSQRNTLMLANNFEGQPL